MDTVIQLSTETAFLEKPTVELKPSQIGSGNRCGHKPGQPRWFIPPKAHKPHPKLVEAVCRNARGYYDNPLLFPTLNACNGSDRQQRSERREACATVLECILYYTELFSLRAGIPQADGSLQGLTMQYIATLTKLSLRRTERAVRDLVEAGLITIHPYCQKLSDTVYKGYAAIRTVSKQVFDILGLGKWLLHERRKAAERLQKKTRKADRKAAAQRRLATAKLEGAKPTQPPAPAAPRANQPRSFNAFIAEMKDILKDPKPPP